MQVGEQYIRNFLAADTQRLQRSEERILAVRLKVSAELVVLFVPDSGINQYGSLAIAHEQRAHGQRYHIIGVGRTQLRPHAARHHTEHGAAIELEKTCQNTVYNHTGQM